MCKHLFKAVKTELQSIKKYATTEFDFKRKSNVIIQVEDPINQDARKK